MKKSFRPSENELEKLIQRVLRETHEDYTDRYMFFSNLEQIHRQTGILLEQNKEELHNILENGHDWAQDHIATAKESIDQVFDFLMNETKGDDNNQMMEESEEDDFTVEPHVPKTPREFEVGDVFGKYGSEVPNDVLRYMRKNPQGIIDRLVAIYGDRLLDRVEKAMEKRKM